MGVFSWSMKFMPKSSDNVYIITSLSFIMEKIQFSNNWQIDSSVFDYLKKCNEAKKPVLTVSDLEEIEGLKQFRANLQIAQKNGMDTKKQIHEVNTKIHQIKTGGLN